MLKEGGNGVILEDYRERVERNKRWHRERMIKDVKVGMVLDVQNKEFIWLLGVVKKIVIRRRNLKFLIIGYRVR